MTCIVIVHGGNRQQRDINTMCSAPTLHEGEVPIPYKLEYLEWDLLMVHGEDGKPHVAKVCHNGNWMCLRWRDYKYIPCLEVILIIIISLLMPEFSLYYIQVQNYEDIYLQY